MNIVKHCPCCRAPFTAAMLVEDPTAVPLGMTIDRDAPDGGHYWFNHAVEGCGSTFVVELEALTEFLDEPVPATILTGTEPCGHHCLDLDDTEPCPQPCRFAPFRRLLVRMLQSRSLPVRGARFLT